MVDSKQAKTDGKPLKKKNRREKDKYPGLKQSLNPRIRWEVMDQDYIKKLNHEEKRWLSNFNEEWMSGNFNHEGEILHKTVESKRECYTRNNARNRDTISVNRTMGWKELKEDMIDKHLASNHEDVIIDLLDIKNEVEKSKFVGEKKSAKKHRRNST